MLTFYLSTYVQLAHQEHAQYVGQEEGLHLEVDWSLLQRKGGDILWRDQRQSMALSKEGVAVGEG